MIGIGLTARQRAAAITAAMDGIAARRHSTARPAGVRDAGEALERHLTQLMQRRAWFGYTAAPARVAA